MAFEIFGTLRRIIQEVNAAPDLKQALNIIVQRVKRTMGVDAASVYFRDFKQNELVLMATDGLNQSAVGRVRFKLGEGLVGLVLNRAEPVNIADGPLHPNYRFMTDTGEQVFHGFLGVPIIQHRVVLGVLVVRQTEVRRFAENEETFLVTLAAQLAGAISHAEAMGGVNELLKEVAGSSFTLKGISGSTGLAIGQAVVVYVHANLDVIPDQSIHGEEVEHQTQLFMDAVNDVARDIEDLSSRFKTSLPPAELALFDAYGLMLKSDTLLDGVQARIREGNWAQGALRDTIADHVRIFDSMDDAYLRERASDIRDLGRRILERLQSKNNQVYKTFGPTVLVGEEIAVSHLAEIPPEHLVAVVSSKGSGASHVAILSHALGIPAVMGVGDLPVSRIKGQTMVVDGYRGQIFVKPTEAMLEEFRRLVREEQELNADLNALINQPSQTTDGVHMPLLVNTGLLADISPSLRSGAEGVGLYRTEVPFLIRDGFPGEDEQAGIYRQVLAGFSPKPVTLRTLDIGGDKMLPYFPQREENPFLGWRGIRIMLDHPEIFLTQIRAVLRASEHFNNLRLMLPMISDVNEVDEALSLIRRAHDELREDGIFSQLPPVGVMIEVPSAVYQMDALAKRVEFFSVGTNDLTQYLLAVDRNNTQVASLYDSLHPAVLRALQHIVNVAHEYGKPVSVCGEMAGNPAAAIILLGLGVDSLSMSAGSLLSIKWVMRSFSQQVAKELTDTALTMEKASAIKTLLHKALEDAGLGGLIRAGK